MALHHALHSAPPNRTPRRANPREEHRNPAALQPRPRPYHPAETAPADCSTARERPRGTPTASAPTEQQTHPCTLRRLPPTQPPPEAGARAEEDLRDVPLRQKQACRRLETRRMQRTVAVAQTPDGLTEAFLRVGSKKPQVVARPRRALLGLGAASPLSDRHSERGRGFRRRLCATATTSFGRPALLRTGARFRRRAGVSRIGLDAGDGERPL